jgi:hypothetical protein
VNLLLFYVVKTMKICSEELNDMVWKIEFRRRIQYINGTCGPVWV